MTEYTLSNPTEAFPLLAATIGDCRTLRLEVSEDKCFAASPWLPVGTIDLHPSTIGELTQSDPIITAIRSGQFSWTLPSTDQLSSDLKTCLYHSSRKFTDKELAAIGKAEKALFEALQDITRRLLLLLPIFDPGIICDMPFRTPSTLILDTSAVKQGALDFACRFLYPMARIKVPAVVPVEILNMADRFLSLRRKSSPTFQSVVNSLSEHLDSQGTQRALLRLEWHSDIEVERPMVGPDPLRAIFKPDSEITETSLSVVQRSLADRLVFESAREHKAQLSPDHKVCVLTSDQGLARMVLAEGMVPIYFDARKTANPIGKKLTGTLFHPFTTQLYTVSLTDVLWELATCFGSARLVHKDGEFQVTAMADDLHWFPYQSRENLLWCRWTAPVVPTHSIAEKGFIHATAEEDIVVETEATVSEPSMPSHSVLAFKRISSLVISVPMLLRFVEQLSRNGTMNIATAKENLGITSLTEYASFLRSGGFLIKRGEELVKEPLLDDLQTAITTLNISGIALLLMRIPTFIEFMELLTRHQRVPEWDSAPYMRRSTFNAYKVLSEISILALTIPGKGICITGIHPTVEQFSNEAIIAYQTLSQGDQWVLTGAWLEELALRFEYHPVTTRHMLQWAHESGLVERYYEGSTIETRFEDHKLAVLERDEDGSPTVRVYRLYHGDFLYGGRASVRIQIERKRQ